MYDLPQAPRSTKPTAILDSGLPAVSLWSYNNHLGSRYHTSWTFNSSAFFADLNVRILQDINETPGFGVDMVGFSIPIKEKGITLTLEQGEVKQISNITYTTPTDIVYVMFPGAITTYTIGKSVLEYRFLISENGTSDITTGYVTFELSGVNDNIMVATFNTTTGNYTANVMTDKISGLGVNEARTQQRRDEEAGETGDPRENPPTSGVARPGIEPGSQSIKLTNHPIENLESYMKEVYQLYRLDMASEATSSLEFYLDYHVDRMNVFKYIGRKAN
ncbi:hypothetical protein PR048_000017 [Dryococelus australis]|uniref:Uncharacterized protein n=1 Tax=Dryococelus australis TaxID=614101 RepID=A0ABQ9IDF8_9NEOP|nr:hypothetical protein PR048_000017 [Dryococelus australis]